MKLTISEMSAEKSLAILAVVLVLFAGAGVAANTFFTASNGFTIHATNGPSVTIGDDTTLDGGNPIGANDSINVGNISIKGPSGSNLTLKDGETTTPNITNTTPNGGTIQVNISQNATINISDSYSKVNVREINTMEQNGTVLSLSVAPNTTGNLELSWNGSPGSMFYVVKKDGTPSSASVDENATVSVSSKTEIIVEAKHGYCLGATTHLSKNPRLENTPSGLATCVSNGKLVDSIAFNDTDGNAIINVSHMNKSNKSVAGSNVSQFTINKSAGNITVTISNLSTERYYAVDEDGAEWKNISTNTTGVLEFNKTGNWSKHSYTVTTQATPTAETPTGTSTETATETEVGGNATNGGGSGTTFTSFPIVGGVSQMQLLVVLAALLISGGTVVLYYRRQSASVKWE